MLSITWIAFSAILLASAVVDILTYRIPNALVLTLMVLFLPVAFLHWNEVEWLSHLGAMLLVLGAGIFVYLLGQMGAGDVKLLAAVALWAGVYSLVDTLFWVSLCGLAGMLVIIVLRKTVVLFSPSTPSGQNVLPQVLAKGRGIPYGIGIGPGAILASFSFPLWLWQ